MMQSISKKLINKVSIILPTYNSQRTVSSTIESVIKQTYGNWELIITDDCSSDSTLKILKKYSKLDKRIKIFNLEKNSGAGVCRNNSIKQSSGNYIAFIDSDDLWFPNKLEVQIEFMISNNIYISYTSFEVINLDGKKIDSVISPKKLSYKDMLLNNYIGCLTVIYDVSFFGKNYMSKIRKRQDWALWLKLLKKVKFAYNAGKILASYRLNENSLSKNKFDLVKYNWIIYRKIEGFNFIKSLYYFFIFFMYHFIKKNKL